MTDISPFMSCSPSCMCDMLPQFPELLLYLTTVVDGKACCEVTKSIIPILVPGGSTSDSLPFALSCEASPSWDSKMPEQHVKVQFREESFAQGLQCTLVLEAQQVPLQCPSCLELVRRG